MFLDLAYCSFFLCCCCNAIRGIFISSLTVSSKSHAVLKIVANFKSTFSRRFLIVFIVISTCCKAATKSHSGDCRILQSDNVYANSMAKRHKLKIAGSNSSQKRSRF